MPTQGPRIRRYRLTSVARRAMLDGAAQPTTRIGGEHRHSSRMYD
jgi:hypothetical protein